MTLTELIALAERVTRQGNVVIESQTGPGDVIGDYFAALSPEVVTAICRCLQAADAMRVKQYRVYDSTKPSNAPEHSQTLHVYDAARAELARVIGEKG